MGGAGGGGGGGTGKKAKKGKGKKQAPTKKSKKNAKGGKKKAKSKKKGAPAKKKKKKGDPVDVVTGQVIVDTVDFSLPGPFYLEWSRHYNSGHAGVDEGLGFGWAHSLNQRLEVLRDSVVFTDETGVEQEFPLLTSDTRHVGEFDRTLWRDPTGQYHLVDDDDQFVRDFEPADADEGLWLLSRIRDRGGNNISLKYSSGRLSAVVDAAGRAYRLEHDANGRLSQILLEDDRGDWCALATYRYSSTGDLIEAVDAEGASRRYTYEDHALTSATNRLGLTFHYRYDSHSPGGRCLETWGDGPGVLEALSPDLPSHFDTDRGTIRTKGIFHRVFFYGPDGVTEVYDPRGGFSRYHSNDLLVTTKAVDAGGEVTVEDFDDLGNLLAYSDEEGAEWKWTRDSEGRVLTETDPLGRTEEYHYDGLSPHPSEFKMKNGGIFKFFYDHRDLPIAATDPLGGVTTWTYDNRGCLVEGVDPIGVRVRCVRDAHGNIIEFDNGRGVFRFTYDAWGRATRIECPDGQRIEQSYDRRGDLTAATTPQGTTSLTYDAEGNLVEVRSPDGSVRRATYGGEGWICSLEEDGRLTQRFRYDYDGELVSVENARGEQASYQYDLHGHLTREVTFDGRQIAYNYSPTGRCIRRVDDAGVTIYGYSPTGELVLQEWPDGSVDEYEYDALGEIVLARNAAGTVTIVRDLLGRPLSESLDGTASVETSYDASGRRLSRTVGSSKCSFQRDRSGLIGGMNLDGASIGVGRDVRGSMTTRRLPSQAVLEQVYDQLGRMAGVRAHKLGGQAVHGGTAWQQVVARNFDYAASDDIVRVSDIHRGDTLFSYDSQSHITSRQTGQSGEHFAYDLTGNQWPANSNCRLEPGDRLVSVGDCVLEYDTSGRVVRKTKANGSSTSSWQYEWHASGALMAVVDPDGRTTRYDYDAFGRRTRKTLPDGSSVLYRWDGNTIAQETSPTRSIVYLFDEDEEDEYTPLAQCDNGRWFHFVTNAIGTPTELIDADGAVAWRAEYSTNGNLVLEDRVSTWTNLRFPGQYYDEESGLHYNRFRYFDPELGRYLSPDPTGLEGGLNLYAYATNSLAFFDPLGWKSTTKLKNAVEKQTGTKKPYGWNAHHVIPEELFDKPPTKGILKKNGVQKDGAKNGIFLPPDEAQAKKKGAPKTVHRGNHPKYTKNMAKKIQKIGKMDPSKQKAALSKLQSDTKAKLKNGTAQGGSAGTVARLE